MKKNKKLALTMAALITTGSLSGCADKGVSPFDEPKPFNRNGEGYEEPPEMLYGPPVSEDVIESPPPVIYGPPPSEEIEMP